jgi:5-(carboxyamino)imidazole ribonucleotide synthase
MASESPIQPGASLGVFGGGQLGRMFAIAAAQLGYRVVVFAPEAAGPAAQVAHEHIRADYDDAAALERFARQCDAITLEFENVPEAALTAAAERTAVRPGPAVLAIAQDRLNERAFLDRHDLPAAPHRAAHSAEDVKQAAQVLGTPLVLKTSRFGYDGHGQVMLHRQEDAEHAWDQLRAQAVLCEHVVDFQCEISVIVARSPSGEITALGPIENHHRHHILDFSLLPASVNANIARQAREIAHAMAEDLALEGLICVEMFVDQTDTVLINELAPRPHNSGHLTIEACVASQFEQQVRAICDMPLGSMHYQKPAVMANLLGELWQHQTPPWHQALARPGLHLHLYGKTEPRPGRKMGHLTVIGEDVEQAYEAARAGRQTLAGAN